MTNPPPKTPPAGRSGGSDAAGMPAQQRRLEALRLAAKLEGDAARGLHLRPRAHRRRPLRRVPPRREPRRLSPDDRRHAVALAASIPGIHPHRVETQSISCPRRHPETPEGPAQQRGLRRSHTCSGRMTASYRQLSGAQNEHNQ